MRCCDEALVAVSLFCSLTADVYIATGTRSRKVEGAVKCVGYALFLLVYWVSSTLSCVGRAVGSSLGSMIVKKTEQGRTQVSSCTRADVGLACATHLHRSDDCEHGRRKQLRGRVYH
jgi:hypothetical protein